MAVAQVLQSLAVVVFMILPGFVFGKIKFFREDFYAGLSSFAVNLSIPALIINSMQVPYSRELLAGIGKTFAFWIPVVIAAAVLSLVFSRLLRYSNKQFTLVMCMLMASNTGFVGIPLCLELYGSESLFYASACEIAGDFFLYSVIFTSVAIASGYKAEFNLRALFLNPPIIAMLIGITLFLLRIRLPEFLGTPLEYFANTSAPIALFVMGSQLSRLSLKDFLFDWRIYIICALRLIVLPLFAFLLVRVMFGDTSLFSKVFIIMVAMPAASVTTTAALTYHSDAEFAAKGVSLSTVLCLLTAPFWAFVL